MQGQVRSRQGAKMDDSDLTIIQVDLIQMDDYPADNCAVRSAAFLFKNNFADLTNICRFMCVSLEVGLAATHSHLLKVYCKRQIK